MHDDRSDLSPHSPGPSGAPLWAPPGPWQAQRFARGRSHADTALVLGILGVVVLPLFGPFAIWQAAEAEKLGVPATAGRVLGWIGTVLIGVGLLFFALWLALVGFLVLSGS